MSDRTQDEQRIDGEKEAVTMSRAEELLHKERYTPAEAAETLNIRQRRLFSAVFGGELDAHVVNGDVVFITRTALVKWIREQDL